MRRVPLFISAVLTLAPSTTMAAAGGLPLAPVQVLRGPFTAVVAGGSFLADDDGGLPSASASVDLPGGSVVESARLSWWASGAVPSSQVMLTLPSSDRPMGIEAEACDVIVSPSPSAVRYWRCSADVTNRVQAFRTLGGTWTMGGVVVDASDPVRQSGGVVGAFAVVLVVAEPALTAPHVVQVSEGLWWNRSARGAASLPFARIDAGATGGSLTIVSLEGDADVPGDGDCAGALDDATCDVVGLCNGACTADSDVLLAASAPGNPLGTVFNESTGNGLDVDTFPLGEALVGGARDDVMAFTQTGADAVLLAIAVVDVPDVDSDGDALGDVDEATIGTDPLNPDTDADGVPDGAEAWGGSPADARSTPTDPLHPDTDLDGLSDGEEDTDHDGVFDVGETRATDPDTDFDGLSDGVERLSSTYPGDACPDGHSNPLVRDTDGDGRSDGFEDKNFDGLLEDTETSPCSPDAPARPTMPPPVDGEVNTQPDAPPVDEEGRPARVALPSDGVLSGSVLWSCASSSSADATVPALVALLLAARLRRRR
jgi:hypothetical protein